MEEKKRVIHIKNMDLVALMRRARVSLEEILELEANLQKIHAGGRAFIILDDLAVLDDESLRSEIHHKKRDIQMAFLVLIREYSEKEILDFLKGVYKSLGEKYYYAKARTALSNVKKIARFFLANFLRKKKESITLLRCSVLIDFLIRDLDRSRALAA
jgi:hypothetical protein